VARTPVAPAVVAVHAQDFDRGFGLAVAIEAVTTIFFEFAFILDLSRPRSMASSTT